MQIKITTERLSLDRLTIHDYEFIRDLVNTSGWLRFIGDRNIYSDEDAVAYISKINSTSDLTYWIVHLKITNAPIGVITFLKRNYLQHFDIGFAFLPAYNGKGYAYEAASEVLSIINRMPEYTTVLATTIPHNIRSIKLLKKLGFHFEEEIEIEGDRLHIYSNVAELL